MVKSEAIKYVKQKSKEGYNTFSILLDLWKDDEDIPQEYLDTLICQKPKKPEPYTLYGGMELMKAFDNVFNKPNSYHINFNGQLDKD